MDNNNITDTNNNIMDNTNIKSIKKKHSFKKKKKARPILSQHGGAKYDFDNLIGVKTKGNMSCWLDSGIQMLWNIDCLRDYLLNTQAEDIKKLKEMTKQEKDQENKEEKKIIEKAVKKVVPNIDETILNTAISGMTLEVLQNINIDFKTKLNIILALQSIFQTYNNKISVSGSNIRDVLSFIYCWLIHSCKLVLLVSFINVYIISYVNVKVFDVVSCDTK